MLLQLLDQPEIEAQIVARKPRHVALRIAFAAGSLICVGPWTVSGSEV